MRILYGVVGEGMGHALRSRVVLEYLLAEGHEVLVVVSGRAHKFLSRRFEGQPRLQITEIHGFTLQYGQNTLNVADSVLTNVGQLPAGIMKNIEAYRQVVEQRFHPEAVITDFESWAHLYGLRHRLPVISIDNMQIINRAKHAKAIIGSKRNLDYRIAKMAVKVKIPRAYHYLVTSFFYPPVKKKRTTLVPPILRREVLDAKRVPGEHVLVYQTSTSNTDLVPALQAVGGPFRVYGMGREGQEGDVTLCGFSESGFLKDLASARAVITGGGYTLIGEALHLRLPILSVPVVGQFEQVMNGRYLAAEGYGDTVERIDADAVRRFLARLPDYEKRLRTYLPHDNVMLYDCLGELLTRIKMGKGPPVTLEAEAMGKWRKRSERKAARSAVVEARRDEDDDEGEDDDR
jgi:uncharacterized protein (TIGR00661 family)